MFLFAVLALGVGVRRFWRHGCRRGRHRARPSGEATHDVLRLKYLDGGHGEGCNDEDDRFTHARRRFHHFTFYGFLLCFAATSVATLYHYVLGWPAPYGCTSLPKLLGIVGGVRPDGRHRRPVRLNLRRHPLQQDAAQRPMDRGFIALLFLTAASGLALMLVEAHRGAAAALCLHLGAVMALFATLPYGKFAHGIYRSAALLKWAIERRQPSRLAARPRIDTSPTGDTMNRRRDRGRGAGPCAVRLLAPAQAQDLPQEADHRGRGLRRRRRGRCRGAHDRQEAAGEHRPAGGRRQPRRRRRQHRAPARRQRRRPTAR